MSQVDVVLASGDDDTAAPVVDQRAEVEARLRRGEQPEAIAKATGMNRERVLALKRALGLAPQIYKSKAAVRWRHEQMRELAANQHTSRQIAAAVGMTVTGCRVVLKELGIDVPSDRVTGRTQRHNATRIVDRIVMDASNLTEGVNLIDFDRLDRAQVGEWVRSLYASRDRLNGFIRRLQKEQGHGHEHKAV